MYIMARPAKSIRKFRVVSHSSGHVLMTRAIIMVCLINFSVLRVVRSVARWVNLF